MEGFHLKILHYIESADVSFRLPWVDLMAEIERRGVRQALLCRGGGNMECVANERGVETLMWKSLTPFFPPANLRYPLLLRRIAPDIVHTRLSNAAFTAGFWGKRLKVPTIAMLDGAYKLKYYRDADRYTACSQWAKDHIVRQGVSPALVDVVYNSIDVKKYARDESARLNFRAERGIRPKEKVFVGAGSFVPAKGFDVLIRAFAALSRERADVRLLIAGDGPLRGDYAALIRELGIEGRASLSDGYVSDVRPWLWGADFFVLPSRGEPFGIVLLEAMASGLPVIATDEGGPSELIADGREGVLIPVGDVEAMVGAMRRFLSMEGATLDSMRGNAEKRLEFFTSEALASRQIAIYERVLAEYGR